MHQLAYNTLILKDFHHDSGSQCAIVYARRDMPLNPAQATIDRAPVVSGGFMTI
jgi:hypothetical protein